MIKKQVMNPLFVVRINNSIKWYKNKDSILVKTASCGRGSLEMPESWCPNPSSGA